MGTFREQAHINLSSKPIPDTNQPPRFSKGLVRQVRPRDRLRLSLSRRPRPPIELSPLSVSLFVRPLALSSDKQGSRSRLPAQRGC